MVRPSQGDKGYIRPTWTDWISEKLEIEGGLEMHEETWGVYTPSYSKTILSTPLYQDPGRDLLPWKLGHNTKDCYQLKKQIEEVVASRKLTHLVKDICRTNQRNGSQGRNNAKVINMIREGGNHKRPFKERRSGLTDELTFPAIPQNQLTDEPIILEGIIEGQDSEDAEFRCREALWECRQLERVQGSWKEVQRPEWIANTIPIKLANGTWKMQVDYSSLNKEYSQIRMTEDDKEKTRFHMEEGVYCFTHMPKVLKTSAATLQRMMEKVLADQRGRNVEIYLEEIVIKSKSDLDLVQDVEETLRKLKRVNIKIDPVMSSFEVKEGRFLGYMLTKEGVRADPEKYPIRKVRVRFKTTEGSGWTNEAEEALQRIKRKLNKLQTLAVPKEGEILMLCLCHKDRMISSVLLVEREGIQIHVSYVSQPLQGMEIFYTPMEKMETLDANEGGTLNLNKELQEKSTPTPRAWRLYLGKETIEEGSGVGIILVIPKERMHSYAIRLKFNTSDYAIDCEALLGGLFVYVSKEGNHTVAIEQERKYKKEIMNATTPFHRFRIIHLPKILNFKAEVLTELATIQLKCLNQEVSVGIKTRASVEETSSSEKGKVTSNVPSAKLNYNWEVSGSN
ncbi:hypothetical protein Tco_0953958 [Tanacetum coccineum]|uniref:Reverse transcriptase domain-containing protein n=1 Tax=Tanacetum coccineum TaxID=301880 RepID=A0ABQ5E333_9ASTR